MRHPVIGVGFTAATLIGSLPVYAGLVVGPTLYSGVPQNVLATGNPGVFTLVDGTFTFQATQATHFLQIEVNEAGNESPAQITLSLTFFEDISNLGIYDGGAGGLEDLGLDYSGALAADPDFSGNLVNASNQDVHEFAFSGLAIGSFYGVVVDVVEASQSNGAELFRFATSTISPIPEASSFLAFGLVAGGLAAPALRRKRASA